MTRLTKSLFLRHGGYTKSSGVFAEMMQMISKICNPKACSDQFTISKDIDAESLVVFLGQSVLLSIEIRYIH